MIDTRAAEGDEARDSRRTDCDTADDGNDRPIDPHRAFTATGIR